MHDIEELIDSMWIQHDENSWRYVETGELHNEYERKGIIQHLLDDAQIKGFHDPSKLYIKYDVKNNRRLINKNSKKPEQPESTCIPWKVSSKKNLIYL